MSETNVTPIRPPKKARRTPRSKIGLILAASEKGAEFSTLDVVNGLHGVCVALDECVNDIHDENHVSHLAMAAKVLSSLVQERIGNV